MSLLQRAPRLDPGRAEQLAGDRYGLRATASPLPSERDQNFLLSTPEGHRFVLKIANASESREFIEAQVAALDHLASRTDLCPRVVPGRSGESIVDADGHLARLVTWIEGRPLGDLRRHSPELLQNLGARLGELDRALESFVHAAARRDFYWDLARGPITVRERLPLVADPDLRRTIDRIVERVEREDAVALARLPRSVVHNDPNDYNVLVAAGRIAGLIDFGDMVHSYTAADAAIAMAYAVLDKRDPLDAMAAIARGYHSERAFNDVELSVLFDLVLLRLCMSVAIAADQQRQRPGDAYLAISQEPIRRTLPRLAEIPPQFAEAFLRNACGLEPSPLAARVAKWLRRPDLGAQPILGTPLDRSRVVVLDLSVGSPLIAAEPRQNAEPLLTARVAEVARDAHAAVAVGRYDEARLLYTSSLFDPDDAARARTIHLGVDLFAAPGTPVRAPLAGRVHALNDNAAPLDYGPVVILEHRTGDNDPFYTLYGHLGRDALTRLRPGQAIAAGEPIATIGTPDVNGGWPPHVHVQVIGDLVGMGTDFPGVCRASERETWRALSPDPNLVLGIPQDLFPRELTKSDTRAARRRVTGRNVSVGYANPLKIVRGWMQYLFDDTGRRYLDAYNNVPHVGHAHPQVAAAVAAQLRVLNTNTRYLHDNLVRLADRLATTLPEPLRVCYFVNSGSEANELALRLARAHTRQRDVIVLDAAYHGNTATLIDVSPYKFSGPGGGGKPDWVHVAPLPDRYRGPFRRDDPDAGPRYAIAAGDAIERMQERGVAPAAFLAETCPSVGGQIVLPPGYLDAVYRRVRAAGGVCIADEVQTAYGRMGTSFYAFEDQHVVPDIVVLGKPIGNGYPLGAVITTDEIASSFDNGMEFFSTFGGSTVSCAAGLAVLQVVEQEELQSHAARVGEHLLRLLRPLADRHAIVGDVRGSGLFLGVELVTNRSTLTPAAAEASLVVNRMCEEGILIGTDGPLHNVLKIRPPMPFDEADAEVLAATLDRVLSEID